MTAYFIAYREGPIKDQDALDEYRKRTRQITGDNWKLTPLVVYGAVHPLENTPPDGVVMVSFPTVEDAKAWYNSPAYQDALPYRQKAADYRVIIVEGL